MEIRSLFVLLFLGVAGHTSIVMAQSAGTFTATGNMTTERWFHTATLLTNGKVLITGGLNPYRSSGWASAGLHDPSTGTFTATGDITTSRWSKTASLRPTRKVLSAAREADRILHAEA